MVAGSLIWGGWPFTELSVRPGTVGQTDCGATQQLFFCPSALGSSATIKTVVLDDLFMKFSD